MADKDSQTIALDSDFAAYFEKRQRRERRAIQSLVMVKRPSTWVASVEVSLDACLFVIYGSDLGRKYPVDPSKDLVIGRSSLADLQIDQESVSRRHAKITNDGKSVCLRDLGSTNGTYINDVMIIDERVLRDGDFIKIGRTVFKFLSGETIENFYHDEIHRLTTVDGLTGVLNRRRFLEQLEREVSRAQRCRSMHSIFRDDRSTGRFR